MKDQKQQKVQRKFKLVYDTASLPEGATPVDVLKTMDAVGFVLYDSTKGKEPKFVFTGEEVGEEELPTLMDAKGKVVDLGIFQKEVEEEVYWKKEFFKCSKSPGYYFENYLTYKPTKEEYDKFYTENNLNLTDDYYKAKDDEGRKVAREALVKSIEEFTKKNITKENLLAKKQVFDKEKDHKDTETGLLLAQFEEATNKESNPFNIVSDISRMGKQYIPSEKYKMYVKKNGQMDKKLLKGTELFHLIRLWKVMKDSFSK